MTTRWKRMVLACGLTLFASHCTGRDDNGNSHDDPDDASQAPSTKTDASMDPGTMDDALLHVQITLSGHSLTLEYTNTDGYYFQPCDRPVTFAKLDGDAWVPLVDDRPGEDGAMYYLDGGLRTADTTCDDPTCDGLRDQNYQLLEYTQKGTMDTPDGASVPAIESSMPPPPWQITIYYYTDETCSGGPSALVTELGTR